MKNKQYYLKAQNSQFAPTYVHDSLESAITEANRLLNKGVTSKLEILQIVAIVERKDVPVVERKNVVTHLQFDDDLPF